MLVFSVSCFCMESADYAKLKTGDIVHVKIEWQGKVYLEGDAVVAFLVTENECAQVGSTDRNHNFNSIFHRSFLTLVSSSADGNIVLLKQENARLKEIIKSLIVELKRIIGILE